MIFISSERAEAGHLARSFRQDRFGTHFLGAGTFRRWGRLGLAV